MTPEFMKYGGLSVNFGFVIGFYGTFEALLIKLAAMAAVCSQKTILKEAYSLLKSYWELRVA